MSAVTIDDAHAAVRNRLAVLQLVRVGLAVAVMVLPVFIGASGAPASVPLAYLLVVGTAELARRRFDRLAAPLLSALVLVDGAFLAAAILLTGGNESSPLLFLAFLEVVAVTLLASHRTGLKVAVWCALLLLLGRTAAAAGVFHLSHPGPDRAAAVSGLAFLLFAVGAAAFQSVNERTLRHTGSELASLVDLGSALERARRAGEVIGVLVAHLRTRLRFARVVVMVRADGSWVTWGDHAPSGEDTGPLGRVADAVLADGQPRLVRSVDDGLLAAQLPGAHNVVVAPLTGDEEPLGLVAAEWGHGARARIPRLTVSSLLQSVAHAALALRNARLLDEVERLATRDEVTGLANRRLFEETFALEVGRHDRTGAPLSLVLLDVDHFKAINDEFGHPAGDAVLRDVGEALAVNTKSFDLAGRYGGDEFVVLLPGCVAADAPRVAERLRAAASRAVHAPTAVALSAGAATMPDDAGDGARLLAAADEALYAAKRGGRDRVETARWREASPGQGAVGVVIPSAPTSSAASRRDRR
jgi:diguanylate cyclase (GGDEF)-like protein